MLSRFAQRPALFRDFVVRDLRSRYVGSSMGFFWSVIFPLINLFVFMFVFKLILETRWGDSQGALEVSLVMLAGIIVWTAFAESISRSTGCLVDNANLIQKVVFPSGILPAYITTSALLNMCIGLPIVLGSVIWFGYLSPGRPAIELENHYAEGGVWEGTEVGGGEDQAPHWPRFFVSVERPIRKAITFDLEYSGTATRGVDYLAEYDEITLPAGVAKVYIPIIPLRDAVADDGETVKITAGADSMTLWKDAIGFVINDNSLPPEEIEKDLGHDTTAYQPALDEAHHALALGPSLVTLPFLLVLLAIFTVGLGSFLAAFNLYWRDTTHLIGVALTVWMFATPIFYPAHMVRNAGVGLILDLNPMYWFIESFRNVVLFGLWPDPVFVGLFAAAAAAVYLVGTRFFDAHEPMFADLL